jgi:Domain of unknown function (DUF1707)
LRNPGHRSHGGRRAGPRYGAGAEYGGLISLSVMVAGMLADKQERPASAGERGDPTRRPAHSPRLDRSDEGRNPDDLRASDSERHQVVQALSFHFADGRIEMTEFDERLGKAMAAKTRAELSPLLADLPSLSPEATSTPPRHHLLRSGLALMAIIGLAAVVVLAALLT